MTIGYGSQVSTFGARDMSTDDVMQPGSIYSANYTISGIKSYLPGWEDEAIISLRNGMESQGFEIVYIGVDSDNNGIDVQWRLPYTGDAQSMAFPVILVYYVAAIVIVAIVAYLLIITLVGAVKEVSAIITENPTMIPIIYGGLAILGLIAIGYTYKQIKGD